MAEGLARLGHRVALLDVDMRRPALHAVIGIANDAGMSSLLTAQHSVDDVLRPTAHENLFVITSGPIPPSPTELISSGRLNAVLQELSARFDVVILDSPPVLGLADAPLMSAVVEAWCWSSSPTAAAVARSRRRCAACVRCIPTCWARC
jgi:capsular exopolysaccharide synthesis family protein